MRRNLVLLSLIGLVLLGLGRIGLFRPLDSFMNSSTSGIQLAFYAAGRNFADSFQTVTQIGSLRGINASLEEEVAILEAENGTLKKLEEENKLLRDQLGVEGQKPGEVKAASVLGYSLATSRGFINIDKGNSDGIQTGDLVVLKDIVLGKVETTSERTSTVKLLTDPESKVLCETSSQIKGVLVGDFGSQMRLTKVLLDDTLREGDLLFTSGEEGMPKGMVVGRISKVKRLEAELFQEAEVEPLVDINKLNMVFIKGN
jgi:rod shape-determining protein MreC